MTKKLIIELTSTEGDTYKQVDILHKFKFAISVNLELLIESYWDRDKYDNNPLLSS